MKHLLTFNLMLVYARLVGMNQRALWLDTPEGFTTYCHTHQLAVNFERMYDPDSKDELMAEIRGEASRYHRRMYSH